MDYVVQHLVALAYEVFRMSVWLVLLVAIFVPLERLFELHPAKFWRAQTGIDLAWYFINSLLPAAIIAVPLSLLSLLLDGLDPFGFYTMVNGLPLWLKVILMLIISDIGAYWYHRISHFHPVLWRFHAIHHSAEHIDWLVNTRAHPVDMVFTRLAGLVPVYLLGLAQTSGPGPNKGVLLVMIIGTIWTFFIHANIRWRFGPLEWLLSTPAFHHWHHTNDEHRDKNFAALFPVIDRVFGTAWLPKHWPPVYGIDAKVPETLSGQFTEPLAPPPAKTKEMTNPAGQSPANQTPR